MKYFTDIFFEKTEPRLNISPENASSIQLDACDAKLEILDTIENFSNLLSLATQDEGDSISPSESYVSAISFNIANLVDLVRALDKLEGKAASIAAR